MKEIDSFVKSMMEGLEQLILTDEEDIDKFLGIDIWHLSKNEFEIVQPFLIDRTVTLLGLTNNKFDVSTNSKATPVGKPLLIKEFEGKLRKLKWKYRTAVGMLTYLQGNLRPEISMVVHQRERFCNNPMLCNEQASMQLGRRLLHTRDMGILMIRTYQKVWNAMSVQTLLMDGQTLTMTMQTTVYLVLALLLCTPLIRYTSAAHFKQRLL